MAANFVYQAKPDGLTILAGGGSLGLHQLFGISSVRYDMLKMPTSLALASGAIFYAKPSVISGPNDLPKAKGLVFGFSSGVSAYLFVCSKELLEFPTDKVTLAYSSSSDSRRAFLAGEINFTGDATSAYVTSIYPLVQKGEVVPLYQTGITDEKGNVIKDNGLPGDVPTVKDLYERLYQKPPSGMAWDAYKATLLLGRTYINALWLPPGMPDNMVKAYWDASGSMVKDPEFTKAADSLAGAGAKWMAGNIADQGFRLNFKMAPEVVDWVRKTMGKYGMVIG
ncbi:MAG: hypothetical protein HYX90_01890 [Chloroflexi bacterium]|nr:hypothetical protein [Chloroflexota bacterium]